MIKELILTIAVTFSYTSYIMACGCAPLSFGKLTMQELNDYDVIVKAIALEVSGPALQKEHAPEKNYHIDSYGYHQVENIPDGSSEITLKVTRTIKGEVDRNLKLVMKNANKYGYYCSYNKIEPGNSYYFFMNKNKDELEMFYSSRLIALKSDYGLYASLKDLKNKASNNDLEELEQKQLEHKIRQFEENLKYEREIKAQNLSFINMVNTNSTTQWFNDDKKLEAVGKLVNGTPVGQWEYYSYDGEFIEEKGAFKKGRRHGEWNRFFNKSEVVLSTYSYKNGLLEGKYTNFYNDGKIQNEAIYKTGKKEGIMKTYHRNGELNLIANFKNDKLNGERVGYLKNGELSLKENYVDGKREGVFVRYFQSGVLKDVLTYENDLPIGKYYRYFEEGSKKQEGQYSAAGVRTGEWKYYNRDGSVRTVEMLDEKGNLALSDRR